MSDHESTPDQASAGQNMPGSLRVALADLADTMPDDPRRVSNVHTRARHLRNRRHVAHATLIAVVVAGVASAAALVAVRPGSTQVSIIPAASESTSASGQSPSPTCSSVLAALPPGSLTAPSADHATAGAKQNIPAPAKGDAGSSDIPRERSSSQGTVDPATKSAAATDNSRYVKSMANIISATPGSLSLSILDGSLAGQSVTALTGPNTVYAVGTQPCVDPELTAGMTVGVLLVRADDGSYSTQQVNLFQS